MVAAKAKNSRTDWLQLAFFVVVVAALPFLIALRATPAGGLYLGSTVSTDDHLVYAAWMHQAKSGHFFFDNRFTTATQPALTVHIYFWVLGLVAKVTGIPIASTIGRLVFSFLFVFQLCRFVERFGWSARKLLVCVVLVVLGGGFGFLVWHNFKGEITLNVNGALNSILLGRLPMDVKQPEAFIFPSMLNNGLFMVSMWLILVIFGAVLDAKDSSRAVVPGMLAMAVLMNIHSYDVLLVAIILSGLLAAQLWLKDVDPKWVMRVGAIAAGAIVPALWFVYVLKSDPVFQARAATETYSLNFRSVLFGLLPLVLLGLRSLWPDSTEDQRPRYAFYGFVAGLVVFVVAAAGHSKGYFLGWPAWIFAFTAGVAIVVFLARPGQIVRNLIVSWAVLGLIAIYFPQLFQRKLAEGIVIPWAILAFDGLTQLLKGRELSLKRLVYTAAVLVCAESSVRWFQEDLALQRANVSTTTVHAPFMSADEYAAIQAIDSQPGRKVVVAMPGLPAAAYDGPESDAAAIADSYLTPTMNDLNPVASGLAGAYSIAGHWSETPNYSDRRKEVLRLFIRPLSKVDTLKALHDLGVTHVIVRSDGFAQKNASLYDVGKPIYQGKTISVIKVD